MRPDSCKAKGRLLQQKITADLKRAFPLLDGNDVRSTSMGCSGEDILMSPLAEQVFPYSVEAKNQERLNIWAAVDQAKANAPNGRTPIVVIKRNREQAHVLLPWQHFLDIVSENPSGTQADTGALSENPQVSHADVQRACRELDTACQSVRALLHAPTA